MANPPVNEKTFDLTNKVSETFSMIISHFAFVTTLLFRIRDRLRLIILPSFSTKMTTLINLRKIKLVIGSTRLITSVAQTINTKRVSFIFSMKERLSLVASIYGRMRMTISSKAIQKAVTTILLKKITLTINPVIATFFTLGYFDPEILGDLDTLTLGEMDYT